MNKYLRMVLLILVLIPTGIFLLLISTDNLWARRRISREVRAIVNDAKREPGNEEHVRQLLKMTHSRWSFKATKATVGLGDVGDAAVPVIHDLAALMRSNNPFVRREAANSLSKLGKRSIAVLPELKEFIRDDTYRGDAKWFAIDAIGEIGPDAIECEQLLESMIGTGAPQLDDSIREALRKIRRDR